MLILSFVLFGVMCLTVIVYLFASKPLSELRRAEQELSQSINQSKDTNNTPKDSHPQDHEEPSDQFTNSFMVEKTQITRTDHK